LLDISYLVGVVRGIIWSYSLSDPLLVNRLRVCESLTRFFSLSLGRDAISEEVKT